MDYKFTSHIQLNWLRTFEVAARHLSFTRAAEELNMSQSAVSQQIQLLEHHVKQPLFIRAKRTLYLSDMGKAFLPLVQRSIEQLNTGAMQIFQPQARSVLQISVNTAFSVLWLSARIANFSWLFPHITLCQTGNNWESDFHTSTAELEIRYGHGHWPELECHQLIPAKIRPYCSVTKPVSMDDISCQPMPLLEVMGTSEAWTQWLEQENLSHWLHQKRYRSDSHAVAVSMAASGFGLCLMYDEMVSEGAFASLLKPASSSYLPSQASYYLCHRQNKALSEAALVFKKWLLSQVEESDKLER